MKKKLCVTLLAMMMVFTLSGCGASDSKGFSESAADMAAPQAAPAEDFTVTEEAVEEEAWDDAEAEMDSGMTDAAAGASEAKAETVQSNEKIIYTYNYSVETKQFDTFMQAVQSRINEYGGYLESSKAEAEINDIAQVKPVAVECCFGNVDDTVLHNLNLIRKSGSKVWINSLWPSLNGGHDDDRAVEANEPDEAWGWILEQGALLIQTDRPAQLIRYLKKHRRH